MRIPDRTEQFVGLFVRHERAVFQFIFSLLPNEADAQDVMQNVAIALWRKFDEYDASKPFLPWACRFAHYEVLSHRRQQNRQATLLDQDVLEQVADTYLNARAAVNQPYEALQHCLEKLPDHDRELIHEHYAGRFTIRELAERRKASVHTLYKAFQRIRRWLFDCVRQTAATGTA